MICASFELFRLFFLISKSFWNSSLGSMAFGSLRYLLMRIAIALFSSIENSLNAFSVMACAKLAFFCSLDSAFELICSFVD